MTRIRSLFCAGTLLLAVTTTATACGQAEGGAGDGAEPGAAAAPAGLDSLLAVADRERSKGPEDAAVTIIEISDFQCPYCREFAQNTYPRIDSAYVQQGKARVVYINLPLGMHREAYGAAEAALCAAGQGRFWPMHDRLFAAQREWSGAEDAAERFAGYARELELDMDAFRDCTENDRVASLILNDAMQASGAGVNGTPTFFLNSRSGQRALSGAVPYEQFAATIDTLLAAPPAEAAPPPAPQQP